MYLIIVVLFGLLAYLFTIDKRLKMLEASKLQSKKDLIPTHVDILAHLVELYTAKYLFKQIPLTLRVEYLKITNHSYINTI